MTDQRRSCNPLENGEVLQQAANQKMKSPANLQRAQQSTTRIRVLIADDHFTVLEGQFRI